MQLETSLHYICYFALVFEAQKCVALMVQVSLRVFLSLDVELVEGALGQGFRKFQDSVVWFFVIAALLQSNQRALCE